MVNAHTYYFCMHIGTNNIVKFKIGVVADQDKDSKVHYYYYYYYIIIVIIIIIII